MYVVESINNWLQDVSATKAFVSCEQMWSCNQLLIDSATYLLTINPPTLKSVAMILYDIRPVSCLCDSDCWHINDKFVWQWTLTCQWHECTRCTVCEEANMQSHTTHYHWTQLLFNNSTIHISATPSHSWRVDTIVKPAVSSPIVGVQSSPWLPWDLPLLLAV